MARDPGLESLLEADLEGTRALTRKPLFGGLSWMVSGHLLCGARTQRMLLRVGKAHQERALAHPGVQLMKQGPRAMPGWVWLDPAAYGEDNVRRELLAVALSTVRALPPKLGVSSQTRRKPAAKRR